tara:strand:+ start:264 stop:776 length:513 start_codon:yes stop_codon:yes gene_type:complete
MGANSWNISPGLQNVGSYQVSGAPYATASVVIPASASLSGDDEGSAASTMCIRFPYVTKWFEIRVSGSGHEQNERSIRVGFSAEGLSDPIVNSGVKIRGGNYFNLPYDRSGSYSPVRYDLKVSELHLMSNHNVAAKVDIVAGLTNIAVGRTEGADGPNWSGSVGVSGQAL